MFRFYYQAYTRSNAGGTEMLTPDGPSQWCVRYAPRNPGSFQVTVTITNSSGTFTLMTDSFQALDVCSMCVHLCTFSSMYIVYCRQTWLGSFSSQVMGCTSSLLIKGTEIDPTCHLYIHIHFIAHTIQLEKMCAGWLIVKVHVAIAKYIPFCMCI